MKDIRNALKGHSSKNEKGFVKKEKISNDSGNN
jgi:hypothetical protein